MDFRPKRPPGPGSYKAADLHEMSEESLRSDVILPLLREIGGGAPPEHSRGARRVLQDLLLRTRSEDVLRLLRGMGTCDFVLNRFYRN